MSETQAQPVEIDVPEFGPVSGLFVSPAQPSACYVLAHGAGAGMHHRFMTAIAADLERLDIATLRFQFPYMQRGSKRTDPPAACHATVRSAVAKAAELLPRVPLLAGGRSFGGRMSSQAQAESALPGVRALVFLGFPLHPAGRSDTSRAAHLVKVTIPMLFVQGTRDELATFSLLEPIVQQLAPRASLYRIEDADHSFHVPARSGRNDSQVRIDAMRAVADWARAAIEMQDATGQR